MKTTELTQDQLDALGKAIEIISNWKPLGLMKDFHGEPFWEPPPDWTRSLDEVNAIERSLLTEEVDRNHYTRILIRVMSDDLGDFITLPDCNVRFASALQCCVALVRVKAPQKWEEIVNL